MMRGDDIPCNCWIVGGLGRPTQTLPGQGLQALGLPVQLSSFDIRNPKLGLKIMEYSISLTLVLPRKYGVSSSFDKTSTGWAFQFWLRGYSARRSRYPGRGRVFHSSVGLALGLHDPLLCKLQIEALLPGSFLLSLLCNQAARVHSNLPAISDPSTTTITIVRFFSSHAPRRSLLPLACATSVGTTVP